MNTPLPNLFPFRGLRYRGGPDLSAVAAPPYDVIDEADHAQLEQTDPHNAVRLILPRAADGRDAYECAATALAEWRANGTLELDDKASYYWYRMSWTDADGTARATQGVIGALELPERAGDGDVLPHERTLPKARSDRLALLRATRANFDPIWLLSLATGVTDALAGVAPISTSVDRAGTHHEIGLVPAARAADVQRLIAGAPAVLADGHHRFETACAYRDEHPGDEGAAAIMTLVVEASDEQLCVLPIHRLIAGAPDLRAALDDAFDLEPVNGTAGDAAAELVTRMDALGALGFIDQHGAALLRPRPGGPADQVDDVPDVLRGVDSVRFDRAIRPLLGDATLTYRDDAQMVAALVEQHAVDAAVLLRPVSVAQIRGAAAARVRMPEKTTFFSPKPRTGMVFRLLDS